MRPPAGGWGDDGGRLVVAARVPREAGLLPLDRVVRRRVARPLLLVWPLVVRPLPAAAPLGALAERRDFGVGSMSRPCLARVWRR